jgi:tetratricopeptide (TPR) repeat protein
MLQFFDGTWEHRAFWGEDLIPFGAPGKESRLPMGPLPKAGAWARLEVEPSKVGLSAGTVLEGWSFDQFGGACYWDAAGITNHFDTPWQKLAVAYHRLGDKPALASLLKRHPAAAAGIGDLYAADQDWKRAIAEYRKAITDQPADGALLAKLARAYQSAGHTRETVSLLAKACADPNHTMLSLEVAALQAWFGQEKELAATRQRILAFAKGTQDAGTAERAVRACSIRPSTDKAELEEVLALGRTGMRLRNVWPSRARLLMALGMAEYRSGNYAAADKALLAAATAGPSDPYVTGISALYRAMSLFRQDKKEEARKLAIAAVAKMGPLPRDEKNSLAGASTDDLILWLVYKEGKAMLEFDAVPPPKAKKDKK